MIKDWLIDILRDPYSGEPLACNAERHCLEGPSSTYPADDDLPNFIPDSPLNTEHLTLNTKPFDYARHYSEDAVQFDYFREIPDRLTDTHLRLLRTTLMRMVPGSMPLLLDVGCGRAFVAERFCPRGVKVVSMDIARANVLKAITRFPFDNHAAVVADAYALPFADGTFDCIIASEIIEHTVDPQAFVASLLAKLKPGGTLLVSTPYRERIAYSLCIHCNCKTPHNAHLHSFDKNKMRRIVQPLGADIVRMRLVGNKLLLRTRAVLLLAPLGWHLWRGVDALLNRLLPKAEHFIIEIKRK